MATDTVSDLASYQQFALQQQQYNNEWSAKQAEITRNWQAEMSNTAHQREVADLKAAGLNPILSANSGASVPSGATGETDTSASGNVGAILQQVLQAQSAREVAAMYNAATINAASIAANASMYGADMAYKNTEDHPNTIEAVEARQLRYAGNAVQNAASYVLNGGLSKDLNEVVKIGGSAAVPFLRSLMSNPKAMARYRAFQRLYKGNFILRFAREHPGVSQRSLLDRLGRALGL